MTKLMMSSGLTLTQRDTELFPVFLERTVKRHERSKHILYTLFPDYRTVEERIYWGVFSWSLPGTRQRWIRKNSLVYLDGLECTPSDIVRDYLTHYYPKPLRCTGIEAREYEKHRSAPLYVRPSVLGDATYVDIKSTYYSIVQNLGWNVAYHPGSWLVPGIAPLDFPLPKDKSARNYLVSIGLPSPVTIWTGRKFVYRRTYNPHINRSLWAVTMDVLHAIARIAISLGATYVHTDGYILPSDKAGQLINAIAAFHLTGTIRHEGPAFVFGFGNYQIGEHRTKGFDPYRLQYQFDNLRVIDTDWLRARMQWAFEHDVAKRLYIKRQNDDNCLKTSQREG